MITSITIGLISHVRSNIKTRCRAITGRTMRCRCKFRYISNFTMASCGFSATARLSCILQRPFTISHAKITHSTRIFMAMMQSRKSESAQFGQILGLSSPTISLPTASLTNWIQYYKQQICLMSSVYSMSICLSVTLCIVAKRYIPQQVSEQVSRKCPLETRFHKFQPLYQPYPLKLPPPKFRNLSYLLCLAFLIMWPFCLCCYNIGKYWYQGDH